MRRFGASTAAKLLAAFGTLDAAWQAEAPQIREQAAEHFLAPASHEIVDRNRRLMRMRSDLPLPGLPETRLPLSYPVMRRALLARGINLGPSLWALVGGTAPATEDPAPEVRPWVFRSGLSARRDPTPGQLALF